MCEHNALGYWWGLALCLTVRSNRARCPATALISNEIISSVYIARASFLNGSFFSFFL